MADPWNLSLDQSCFEDWNEDKVIIRGEDLTDVYKRINSLQDELHSDSDFVKLLDKQLLVFLDISISEHDIHSAVRILHSVATKLQLFPESIILLLAQSSKKIFFNLLEAAGKECSSQEDLKQVFDTLNMVLASVKTSQIVSQLVHVLEVIEHSYRLKFEKPLGVSDFVFKGAFSLLLQVLPVIEQENSRFGPGISQILKILLNVGKYACKLDPKSMASVWKLILKTLQQHPSVSSELELGCVITFLVNELVSTHFDAIAKSAQLEQRHAKIIGFLLKVVVGLSEKDSVLESELPNEEVLKLVVGLQKFTSDAARIEFSFSEEVIRLIETNITLTIHPFVENLVKTSQIKRSLERAIRSYPHQDILYLLRLMGLMMTPCYSSHLLSHLTAKDLLEMFLSVAEKAHADFNNAFPVHGVRHSGQGLYTVPLYELLITQACSCVAVLPPDSLSDCVAVLLYAAIRRGYWAHLLASDILAFLSRFGTAQFCLELVQHIFTLNLIAPNHRSSHLLNRLVPLLSNNGRTTLLKSHPVENHPEIWATINWNSFTPEQQMTISRSIVPTTANSLNASAIIRLSASCKSGNRDTFKDRNDIIPWLIRVTPQLISRLSCKQAEDYHRHIEHLTVCSMKALLAIMQPEMKEQHLQLMQILKMVLDAKALTSVLLEASSFLLSIGPVGFPTSPQQPAILRVVTNIFSECLASSGIVVQFHALNAFEVFLKTTPHASIAPSCIAEGQDQLVKQYISRISSKSTVQDLSPFWKSQAESLAQGPCFFKNFPSLPFGSALSEAVGYSDIITNGTVAKRPRLESDEKLQFVLSNLSKIVSDIGTLCPIPAWAKDEIREKVAVLNSYL